MSIISITNITFASSSLYNVTVAAASLPHPEFVVSPPKTIAEVIGERVVAPLINFFSNMGLPTAAAQEIEDPCKPYADEFYDAISTIQSLQEVATIKGKFLAENQKLEALQERLKLKSKQDLQLRRDFVSPRFLADSAVNRASGKGLGKNDYQIALEASILLDSYSITENDDTYRFVDNLNTARMGGKKNKQLHFDNQIAYLINSVFGDNSKYTQSIKQSIQQQKIVLDQANSTYQQKLSELELMDDDLEAIMPPDSPSQLILDNCHYTHESLQNYYIDNENQVNQKVQRKKRRWHQYNDSLHRRKTLLASGIAKDICRCFHVTDHPTKQAIMHQLYAAMDDSDRRWFNDVVGVIHEIIEGVSGDFAYKSQGLKRIYDKITDVLKEIASHNENSRQPLFQATLDSQGLYFGTPYNPQFYQVYGSSRMSKIESGPLVFPPRVGETEFEESLIEIEIDEPFIVATEKEESKRVFTPISENAKVSPNLNNIKNVLKLAGATEKILLHQKGIGRIATSLDFVKQVQDHGLFKGSLRTWLNAIMCYNPYSATIISGSRLFNDNAPKENDCKIHWETYNQAHEYNKMEGNFITQSVELELLDSALKCSKAAETIRGIANTADGIVDTLSNTK